MNVSKDSYIGLGEVACYPKFMFKILSQSHSPPPDPPNPSPIPSAIVISISIPKSCIIAWSVLPSLSLKSAEKSNCPLEGSGLWLEVKLEPVIGGDQSEGSRICPFPRPVAVAVSVHVDDKEV